MYTLTVFTLFSAEIPLLLVFFGVVFLSSVAAYVHLYVREAYTFGIFVTLDFFQVYKVIKSLPSSVYVVDVSLHLCLLTRVCTLS